MNSNKSITATFTAVPSYSLSVSTSGSGTVTKSPNQATYTSGSTVTLTATPAPGYVFSGWSGDASGTTNPLSVTMNNNKSITATFVVDTNEYSLSLSTSGSGTVSKSPNQTTYTSGSTVSLTATPAAGYVFSGWSGDATGTANPLSVTMTSNKSITATFVAVYSLSVSTSGSGTVAKSPNQATYTSGSTVSLTATPASGYAFTGWSGDASGTANPLLVTMNSNKNITATFTALPSGPQVTGFVLVDASTEQDIRPVSNGDIIALSSLPDTKLNIRGNTSPSTVGSVVLELSGTQSKTYTDDRAPYTLHGDNGNGNYYYGNWNPPATGTYTLKATPYSGSNGTGTPGTPLIVSFTFVQSDQTPPAVVSIKRQTPATTTTGATSVVFRASFSEKVNGVDASDFVPTVPAGTLSASVSSVAAAGTDGSTYDITVSPVTGNGELRLDLKASGTSIVDGNSNAISGGFTAGESYTILQDFEPPVVLSISRQSPEADSTNATAVTFRAVFSEGVNGVDANDFSLAISGALTGVVNSVAAIGTDGSTYDIVVSPVEGDGKLRLDLKASGTGIGDGAGNPISGGFTTGETYTIRQDVEGPVVLRISRQSPAVDSTDATSVTFRAVFSEEVFGLDEADFTVVTTGVLSGAVSSVAAVGSDGTTFDIVVSPVSGDGKLRLDLNDTGTGITDVLGNTSSGGFTSGEVYTIRQDLEPPVVLSISRQLPEADSTLAGTVTFRATFSEGVTGVDAADFAVVASGGLSGGSIAAVTEADTAGISYDITVNSFSGEGNLRLDLNAAGTGVTDVIGNTITSGFTSGEVYMILEAPEVVSISRQSPAADSTDATAVTFRAVFSEAVSGVDEADFALSIVSGTISGEVSAVVPVDLENTIYDIVVGAIEGDGKLRLDLKADSTGITDAIGNAISGGFTSGEIYTIQQTVIDAVAPEVLSINRHSPPEDSTGTTSVTFRATFSEGVSGVDKTDFTLTTVSGTVSGSISVIVPVDMEKTIYDIVVSSIQGDGVLRLDLNAGGTGIADGAGNAISGGFTTGETYTIQQTPPDEVAPVVQRINRQSPLSDTTDATIVTFRATFSEAVSGVDAADFTLVISGALSGAIDAVAAADTTGISYDISIRSILGNGVLRLDLKSSGTGIVDGAGNAIGTGFTTGEKYVIEQDVEPPVALSINRQTPATDTTDATAVTFRATFSEAVSGVDAADFTLIPSGAVSGAIGSVAAVGTDSTAYDIVVSSILGDGKLRLDLNSVGTGIEDGAGNAISSGFTGGESYVIKQDVVAPVVQRINRELPLTDTTDATAVTFRATFSEAVSGVDAADFTLVISGALSGAIDAVAAADTTGISYDISIRSILGNGVLRLDLKSSGTGIVDGAGNAIGTGFTTGEKYVIEQDVEPPVALSINRQTPATDTTDATAVTFRATFSEAVSGVDAADFTLIPSGAVSGAIDSVAVVGTDSTAYDIVVSSILGDGKLRLDLNSVGTGIEDGAGNAISSGLTSGQTYTIIQTPPDTEAPEVASINRLSPPADSTDATSVTYRAIFSEAVSGVDEADFALTILSGTVSGAVSVVVPVDMEKTIYDIVISSIQGDGKLRLDLNADSTGIVDAAGNAIGGGFTSGEVYTIQQTFIDAVAPQILSINRQSPLVDSTGVTSVTFRATFSEGVSGVDKADFTLTTVRGTVKGKITVALSVDKEKTTYDIVVGSIKGDGKLRLDLNSGGTGITDGAGNAISGGFTTGEMYTIRHDLVAPVVLSINRQSPAVDSSDVTAVTFRATFSEEVTGVDAADFAIVTTRTLTGVIDSVTAVGTDGTTYDIFLSQVLGDGKLRLDLNASGTGIKDIATNAISGGFTTGEVFTIRHDLVLPELLSISRLEPAADSTDATAVTFRATFSEEVSGVDAADFAVVTVTPRTLDATIASVVAFGTGGTTYDIILNPVLGDGKLRLDLKATGTRIEDPAGNAISGGFTTGEVYTIRQDLVEPELLSLNRQSPLADSTDATSVTFRATFSEGVIGVDAADFAVVTVTPRTLDVTINAVVAVGTDGTTYDIVLDPVLGDGKLRLDLKASGTGIADPIGNMISGGFTTGEVYTIRQDLEPPVVLRISRHLPVVDSSDVTAVTYRAVFSEGVLGVDAADFSVVTTNTLTGTINSVVAVGTDGTTYDILLDPVLGDGKLRLDLKASGTGIADPIGNVMNSGFTSGEVYTIRQDVVAPVMLSINRYSPAVDSTDATSVTFQATFSEGVKGVDAADFTVVTTGVLSGVISAVVAVGTDGTTYNITLNPVSGNGDLRLDLKASGTGIRDIATNPISGGFTTGEIYEIQQRPTLLSISRKVPVAYTTDTTSVTYRAVFSERVTGVDAADFNVVVSGTLSGVVKAVAAVGTEGTTYDIPVGTIVGDGILGLALKTSGTGIVDVTGNAFMEAPYASESYNVQQPPTVLSIKRYNPTTSASHNASSVIYRVSFSERVTGVDYTDFIAKAVSGPVSGVLAPDAVAPVGTDGKTYEVTISSITDEGILRLDLKPTGTGIADAVGNAIRSGFTTGETYIFEEASPGQGFSSVIDLAPLEISKNTQDKPQSKVWMHDGKHWTVLPDNNGTHIWRLDSATWTRAYTVSSTSSSRADCKVVGNVVHIFLFRGSSTSYLASVQYDAASKNYKAWSQRSGLSEVDLDPEPETATMDIDGTGRMWVAYDGRNNVKVRWSDPPYTAWSAPDTLATGIHEDDICAVVALPGKVGVLWSNQNTKLFGFRTHTDGAASTVWSADEAPCSSSAQDVGYGMADDHMNMAVGSDGTLYCAVKTGFDKSGYIKLALMVRRAEGSWDGLYKVTDVEGTRPIILLNEAIGKIRIVYTEVENGGNILYRESQMYNVSFSTPLTLMRGTYNYVTSIKDNHTSEVVILASNDTAAVGVLGIDGLAASSTAAATLVSVQEKDKDGELQAYPNPFTSTVTITYALPEEGEYTLTLYDSKGAQVNAISRGRAEAGELHTVEVDGTKLSRGLYFIRLQTAQGTRSLKLVLEK
ncbi:InlB B-repeat-containing protein [Botryobacter ruber]|uniref:InlB B-repeat-containing protein n=1 Tax=Botryobacter ruber TaxID=2171629 RepID=UPI001F0CB7B0